MEKTIIELLYELKDAETEYSENDLIFIQRPINFGSHVRICAAKMPEGGWGNYDGGVHDGKTFFAPVTYVQSFNFFDWTIEDIFYEVCNRREIQVNN